MSQEQSRTIVLVRMRPDIDISRIPGSKIIPCPVCQSPCPIAPSGIEFMKQGVKVVCIECLPATLKDADPDAVEIRAVPGAIDELKQRIFRKGSKDG